MPIKYTMTKKSVKLWYERQSAMLEHHLIQALHSVGLEATTIARTTHKYLDRTGNLTSSIGYIIVNDGEIINISAFDVVENGSQGAKNGKDYAKELAKKYSEGLCLIIVAGMPYAGYVEALGLNVLDAAGIYATEEAVKKINDVIKLWSE